MNCNLHCDVSSRPLDMYVSVRVCVCICMCAYVYIYIHIIICIFMHNKMFILMIFLPMLRTQHIYRRE